VIGLLKQISGAIAVTVIMSVAANTASAGAGAWPLPRGDAHNTASISAGLVAPIKTVWTAAPPHSDRALMCTSGHTVYIAAGRSVYACDMATGRTRWTADLSTVALHLTALDIAPSATSINLTEPVVLAGRVVVGICTPTDGYLVSLDAATGKTRWVYGEPTGDAHDHRPILSAAILYRGRIVVRQGQNLVALRAENGSLVWTTPFGDPGVTILAYTSHPAVEGHVAYFNADSGVAYAVDLETGRPIWRRPTGGFSGVDLPVLHRVEISLSACAPLFVATKAGDTVMVADGNGNMYALDTVDGAVRWTSHLGYVFQFACPPGTSKPAPVYAATNSGFYEIAPETGKILRQRLVDGGVWRCALSAKQAVLAFSPLTVKGWEVFDLADWKTVWREERFTPLTSVAAGANRLALYGSDFGPNGVAGPRELRVYCSADSLASAN